MKTQENAVVYARYSSHSQTEQSIEGQLNAAYKYAEAKGYNIIHEYCDRAKTGTNDNREEFQKMLRDCSKRQFSVIIVWKVDRFGRNREEIIFNKHKAKKYNVRVEYIAENIGSGPESILAEALLEGLAEYYSVQLSQNIRRGNYESAKKHRMLGGTTLIGYRPGPDLEYVIDENYAPIVRRIFKDYADGKTSPEIISDLNSEGFRMPSGKPFSRNGVLHILKNEKYIGVYTYKDLIRDEDAIPAIVDKDLFDKVQSMMRRNRSMPCAKYSISEYILTDKLFCGYCKGPMQGMSGNGQRGVKYEYYSCEKHRRTKTCKKKSIRKDFLEELVVRKTLSLLQDDSLFDDLLEQTWAYYASEIAPKDDEAVLENRLQELSEGLQRLLNAVAKGIDYEDVKPRYEAIKDEIKGVENSLYELRSRNEFVLTKDHLKFFLEKVRDFKLNNKKLERKFLDTFVEAIYVYDDKVQISLNVFEKTRTNKVVTINSSTVTTQVERIGHKANIFICVDTGFVIIEYKI